MQEIILKAFFFGEDHCHDISKEDFKDYKLEKFFEGDEITRLMVQFVITLKTTQNNLENLCNLKVVVFGNSYYVKSLLYM
jgi:hypothetical protein